MENQRAKRRETVTKRAKSRTIARHKRTDRVMPIIALAAVLLAAATHATWNLFAKRAAGSVHFVWMYSGLSVLLYTPIIVWIVIYQRPEFHTRHWLALAATSVLH